VNARVVRRPSPIEDGPEDLIAKPVPEFRLGAGPGTNDAGFAHGDRVAGKHAASRPGHHSTGWTS